MGVEVTSVGTRPVENVVITTKGLHDRNNLLLDERTVENKGKLILPGRNLYKHRRLNPVIVYTDGRIAIFLRFLSLRLHKFR